LASIGGVERDFAQTFGEAKRGDNRIEFMDRSANPKEFRMWPEIIFGVVAVVALILVLMPDRK